MAKDKKKKKKGSKKAVTSAKVVSGLKSLSENRLVADVVASALVATAAALKDSKTARRLAAEAGDELEKLAKEGAERGNAMWQLALEVGRRAITEISGEPRPEKAPKARKAPKAPKAPKTPRAPKAPVAKSRSKLAKRSAAKPAK